MQQQPQLQPQVQSPFANAPPSWYSPGHPYQQHMGRRNDGMPDFRYGAPPQQHAQQHQPSPVQPPMNVNQQHAQQHAQHQPQHAPQPPTPQQQQQQPPQAQPQPPAPAQPAPSRQRKRPAPAPSPVAPPVQPPPQAQPQTQVQPPAPGTPAAPTSVPVPTPVPTPQTAPAAQAPAADDANATPSQPPAKKSRTNTPWTPAEEQRLKQMRDAGNSWAEIAKTFPSRTEGSVKKHWYKDMHYAEFAEDESQALLNAIKEYENNKWKVIGQKVGKPAKACEQYAKEHFAEHFQSSSGKR
ncbi:uncharacterized protein E0L32_011701 [Thyridium curvatum]|uniref:Uncharacterized protein n=1 Tax=Thyridium curvatum TaxID=1093900 RepID=A0A507BEK5_9PEZI|nr:uncharacterized protein E0L32_011684 [Thyridium curvatum]XP_031000125.1 uncharacterized protein E0L32_011701 [Thyridium curvatum]TPX18397.1 hypothetical protein E0L32_011684 [Thyridium curvatum]TPX18414.1 hypothetical protein E0L32_011701 [Thyridium curvatum]